MSRSADPASVAGKQPPIDAATDLLIIGAGPAGLSAALAAAGQGAQVTLVDENPIPLKTMGEDVPLHFGGRMAPTLANQNAVLEQILAANPQILQAMDAGVDVRLGTAAWGLFPPHPTAAWLEEPVAGLADHDSIYLMRFKQAIVATGRRDMGLAFPGWHRPGVMGASAAYRLANTYDALETQIAVLVGSDTNAFQTADALAERGVRIAAIIEQSTQIAGPPDLLQKLISRGTRILTGHVVKEAYGNSFGVTAVEVVAVTAAGRWIAETTKKLPCDTVLLGVGAVPTIELLEASGCSIQFQPERGGHVPLIDASQRTSLPSLYAAGDCAGIWPSKTLSESIAQREGRIAAHAALRALGSKPLLGPSSREEPDVSGEPSVTPDLATHDISTARTAWVRASVLNSPASVNVCQCEDVTAQEVLSLQPPRYLGWTLPNQERSCPPNSHDHPLNPDVFKRLTRAGMGPCQGRRCREQIAALIALDARIPLEAVPLATYRPPVRPLTLAQLASLPESPRLAPHWDSWFGMPTQWIPFWRLHQPNYTVATRDSNAPPGGE